MHKVNLSDAELDKVKVLADFLMFDQHSERLTFPRFEECIGILTKEQKFPLKDIFMEICGKNRKYITFTRLLRAYCEYKHNSNERSVHFKNFFSHCFTTLLKDITQITGRDIAGNTHFSTQIHKNRDCITKVKVYTNSENQIQGIFIEYDDLVKNEFIAQGVNVKTLSLKIDLSLKVLEDFDGDGDLDEDDIRDYITHVYGFHTTKIEGLGFKCSSGKQYFTGTNIGTPFVLGKNACKLHYIKLGLKDGFLTYIKPYFLPTTSFNFNLDVDLEDVTEEFFQENDELYDDEIYLANITDPAQYEKHVLIPLLDDNCFFHKDEDDCCGDSLDDMYSCESFCTSEEEGGEEHHHHHAHDDDLEKELLADIDKYKKQTNFDSINKEYQIEYTEENTMPLAEGEAWDRISPRTLDVSTLFSKGKNLEALVEKYRADIQNEIEYKKHKKTQKDSENKNFYIKYIDRNNEHCSDNINIGDVNRLEKKFNAICQRSIDAIKKNSNDNVEYELEYYEEDEYGNLNKISGREKGLYAPMELKEVVFKWRKYSEYLKRKVVRFGIAGAFGIAKAIEIMQNVENDFEDNKNSLDTKVVVFEILTKLLEKRRLLNAYNQEKGGFDFARKKLINQMQRIKQSRVESKPTEKKEHKKKDHNKINNQDGKKKNNGLVSDTSNQIGKKKNQPETYYYPSSNFDTNKKPTEPKKTADQRDAEMDKLSKNVEILEKKLKDPNNDAETQKAIQNKIDSLRKEKAKLIDEKVEDLKNNVLQTSKVDVNNIKKKAEEKRQKLVEQKKEEAKIKKAKEEGEMKKLLVPPVTFGELDLPKDLEIYRSQEIVKGKEFTDERFPPKKASLCPFDEENESWLPPTGIEEESDLVDWETYEWERIDKIFRSDDYQVFAKGVEASDIIQGSLGDCYFLSAIAGLCRFPSLIEKLFLFKEKSLDRCYGVYLRINGLWELVLLDDYVPCFGSFRKKFAFSNANGKEMWVVLIEKAWAKINGSYAKAIAGQPAEVFDAICNAYSETTSISPHMQDTIWLKIVDGKNNGYIMTAGTGVKSGKLDYETVNLVEGHAYTLLGCEEVSASGIITKLVKLRNPWGSGEWSGNWSDSSSQWTPKLREQLVGEGADDGVFFMSYEDFIKYYVTLGICKIHQNFHYSYLKFKKDDTLVPQLMKLDLSSNSGKSFIQLHQKNPRFLLSNGKYGDPTLAFLLLVDKNFNYVASASGDTNNITIEASLNTGTYYLYSDINYRYIDKNELHGYNITTYSENPISISLANKNLIPYEVLKKALINYSMKNFEPTSENELTVYSAKTFLANFSTHFTVIENKANKEAEIEFNLISGRGRKSSCLFPDTEFGNVDKITKKIQPKQAEIFICLKFKIDSRVETSWKAKTVLSDEELEKTTVKSGTTEELDEGGNILQTYYQYSGGYGLLLENKTRDKLKMKLEVENLSYNDKVENEILFDIGGKTKKFFHLKIIPGAKNISFNFGFDE